MPNASDQSRQGGLKTKFARMRGHFRRILHDFIIDIAPRRAKELSTLAGDTVKVDTHQVFRCPSFPAPSRLSLC